MIVIVILNASKARDGVLFRVPRIVRVQDESGNSTRRGLGDKMLGQRIATRLALTIAPFSTH